MAQTQNGQSPSGTCGGPPPEAGQAEEGRCLSSVVGGRWSGHRTETDAYFPRRNVQRRLRRMHPVRQQLRQMRRLRRQTFSRMLGRPTSVHLSLRLPQPCSCCHKSHGRVPAFPRSWQVPTRECHCLLRSCALDLHEVAVEEGCHGGEGAGDGRGAAVPSPPSFLAVPLFSDAFPRAGQGGRAAPSQPMSSLTP